MASYIFQLSKEIKAAIAAGDLDTVQSFIHTIDPGYERQRALESVAEFAVEKSQLSILEFSLETGARPLSDFAETAIYKDFLDGYHLLVRNGLTINKPFRNSGNALNLAVSLNKLNLVTWLLDQGADVNNEVLEGRRGSRYPLHKAVVSGSVEMFQLLLSRGADPAACEAMHHAAYMGNIAMLDILFNIGVDINRNIKVETPSSDEWDEEYRENYLKRLYLQIGTPLHFAVQNPHRRREVVEWLLDHGADPLIKDQAGRSILEMSVTSEEPRPWPELELILRERNTVAS